MARVLDLHLCEVVLGGAETIHPPAGVQGEVGGVGRAEQMEAQPVGIVLALAAPTGAKKPLGVVSAPTTSATSHSPARICARALAMATAPEAQAA